jgi:hypothetical protein
MAEAVAGVSLDDARNRTANNPISYTASRCPVLDLTSQEDEQIARHIWALFSADSFLTRVAHHSAASASELFP